MKALITGITGQDGSYLAEFLLEKKYEVYGLLRRTSIERYARLDHIRERVNFLEGDLSDQTSLDRVVQEVQPDEVYNLAAQSFVAASWNQPALTADVTGLGVLRILEAVRRHCPSARFLQASSSEMFGKVVEKPQTERTPFHPRSPYAAAKAFGHYMTINYRESYGLFACACICFNHESPRRGTEFVTRKITQHVARIKHGLANRLMVGNVDAKRDWGYAADYVRAMWLMLQEPKPEEFVIATGETHSVSELLDLAFSCAGLDWTRYVEIDPKLLRPAEVDYLCGVPAKAGEKLGWKPTIKFDHLVEMMVEADLKEVEQSLSDQKAHAAVNR